MTIDDHNLMHTTNDSGRSQLTGLCGMSDFERRTALLAFGSLLVGACASGGNLLPAQSAASIATRNKASYLAAKAAYNSRNLDACLGYYAPDHQIMSKPTQAGREHIRRFFENTFTTWPDIQVTVETALAEGEWVFGRSLSIATHSVAVMGVAPTGIGSTMKV
jgi:predicted ester cyclase